MATTQKQIMDKIQQYRTEEHIWTLKGNDAKSAWYGGRADGLEEAYKILISTEGN